MFYSFHSLVLFFFSISLINCFQSSSLIFPALDCLKASLAISPISPYIMMSSISDGTSPRSLAARSYIIAFSSSSRSNISANSSILSLSNGFLLLFSTSLRNERDIPICVIILFQNMISYQTQLKPTILPA